MFETRFPRALALSCATLLSTLGLAAFAQPAAPSVADQTNTMDAQIQILRKQAELNQALAQAAGASVTSLPRVLAVFGFNDALAARLLLQSGVVSNFKEGETVRTGMTVLAITPKAVMVSVGLGKKLRTVPLEFVAGGNAGAGAGPFAGTPLPPGTPAQPVPVELLPAPPVVNVGAGPSAAR